MVRAGSDEETEALGRSSSEGRRVQKEMEPQAKGALEVGEEVALCTDADGRPVVLGRGSWGHIYLATRWGTQVYICPPAPLPCPSPPTFPAPLTQTATPGSCLRVSIAFAIMETAAHHVT